MPLLTFVIFHYSRKKKSVKTLCASIKIKKSRLFILAAPKEWFYLIEELAAPFCVAAAETSWPFSTQS